MGKSHIGLVYSQQINEVLDQLANLVSTSGPPRRLPFHSICWPPGPGPCAEASHGSFLGWYIFKIPSSENGIITLDRLWPFCSVIGFSLLKLS